MNKERMVKIATYLDKYIRYGMIFYLLFQSFQIILGAILIGYAEPKIQEHEMVLDYARIVFSDNVLLPMRNENIRLELGLINTVVATIMNVTIYRLIRKILATIKEGRPFDEAAVLNIKKIANVWLIFGVIWQVLENVGRYIRYQHSDLVELIGSERIAEFTYEWELDLRFLLIAAILYMAYYIFRYGEVLQQESDETL